MILYPMVLVVCFSLVFVKRIHDFINPGHPLFSLTFIAGIFMGCIGTLNAIIYGFTESVRKTIFSKCFGK